MTFSVNVKRSFWNIICWAKTKKSITNSQISSIYARMTRATDLSRTQLCVPGKSLHCRKINLISDEPHNPPDHVVLRNQLEASYIQWQCIMLGHTNSLFRIADWPTYVVLWKMEIKMFHKKNLILVVPTFLIMTLDLYISRFRRQAMLTLNTEWWHHL